MFKLTAGLRQVLAVDVLTGKAKQMLPDKNLRQPPEVEDQSILRYSCCLEAGCCSVPLVSSHCAAMTFRTKHLQYSWKIYVAWSGPQLRRSAT